MQSHGVRFLPLYGRQSFNVDGRVRFWGGLTIEAWGGGSGTGRRADRSREAVGRCAALRRSCGCADDAVRSRRGCACTARRSRRIDRRRRGGSCGRRIRSQSGVARALSRTRLGSCTRARHPLQHRRRHSDGTRCRRRARGHWSGCHAVGWDANAPEFGDLAVGDGFQKHSYPFGIMVNTRGQRFVDEGADFRNYTYAKYGREILRSPDRSRGRSSTQRSRTCCATSIAFDRYARDGRVRSTRLSRKTRRRRRGRAFARRWTHSTPRSIDRRRSIQRARTVARRVDSRCRSRTGQTRWTRRRSKRTR